MRSSCILRDLCDNVPGSLLPSGLQEQHGGVGVGHRIWEVSTPPLSSRIAVENWCWGLGPSVSFSDPLGAKQHTHTHTQERLQENKLHSRA